jgi:hypothetical protein
MTRQDLASLLLTILRCDSEDEVIAVLQLEGLWENRAAWRYYGDRDGNYATIGNQQSRPEAALVEKIVNSVDARLMLACLLRGIDPCSPDAPQTIQGAVRLFFEDMPAEVRDGGTVASWGPKKRLEEAQRITMAVTGERKLPCITISDLGEGQEPEAFPETFLSIDRSNKLRIPFVQGKFNMGGTGALNFCGQHSLQLILSRRHPQLVTTADGANWGFTIVRRNWPHSGAGEVRSSVFEYLAPLEADVRPNQGRILRFAADSLPVLPEQNAAYAQPMLWGTLIKLFQYQIRGASHVLMKGGLLSRLELLLPDIALPVRVHECRDYRGEKERSFANSLVGFSARLSDNRAGNLEAGFPMPMAFRVRGEDMAGAIYAFEDGRAESYRTNEGIVFTVNGQTHGYLPKTFFTRSTVKMGRLAQSLIVVVDCSRLSLAAKEKLFMNSRDRLRDGELRNAVEDELEEIISKHPALRDLRERRQAAEISRRLDDSRPLEDVLKSILKTSPSLEKLFLLGERLANPHRRGEEGGNGSGGGGVDRFEGRAHPTFFHFHKAPNADLVQRTFEQDRRCRIRFETDARDDYFQEGRGTHMVEAIEGPLIGEDLDSNPNLHRGIANWSVTIPPGSVVPGDEITLQFTVTDPTELRSFVNVARLRVVPKSSHGGGAGDRTELRRGNQPTSGDGPGPKGGASLPGGLSLPKIVRVARAEWDERGFDELSACAVIEDPDPNETNRSVFTFYVNIDNVYLRTDMKLQREDPALTEAKFVYGNVLVGLAILNDFRRGGAKEQGAVQREAGATDEGPEETIARCSRALGPFLVPMINYLGALTPGEIASEVAARGDNE